jgi:hypothetical protein
MTRHTRALAVAALALAVIGSTGRAYAGRIGGPAAEFGTVPAGQSVFFTIPFEERAQATVAVMGNGPGNVDLYIYDADGNVTEGGGMAERRSATVNVYRAGYFRVELRNTGTVPSTVLVGTN